MKLALLTALIAGQAAAGPVYFAAPKRSVEARDAPGGAVVGLLPGGPGYLEAVEIDISGAWALVALAESGGWISTAGLTPAQPPAIAGTAIPEGLRCIGTEPFWSVRFSAEGATYETPGSGDNPLALAVAAWPDGAALPLPVRLRNEGMDFVGVLDHATCADGMSDRPYGWSLSVRQRGAGPAGSAQTGCCFLPRGG
jgi:uncharacterized membrane protein